MKSTRQASTERKLMKIKKTKKEEEIIIYTYD